MSIKNRVKFFNVKIKQKDNEKYELKIKMDHEIEEVKKKYYEQIDKIDEQTKKYAENLNYYQFLERYSTFDANAILDVLKNIVSIFEGNSYNCHTTKIEVPSFGVFSNQFEEETVILLTTIDLFEDIPNLYFNSSNNIINATKSLILRGKIIMSMRKLLFMLGVLI